MVYIVWEFTKGRQSVEGQKVRIGKERTGAQERKTRQWRRGGGGGVGRWDRKVG